MEDEADLSFLTQSGYEESLMNEQIMEESLYQADDQEGYNLRSIIVAPMKKSPSPTNQPVVNAKNIASPTKKMVVPPRKHPGPLQPSACDLFSLKPHHMR